MKEKCYKEQTCHIRFLINILKKTKFQVKKNTILRVRCCLDEIEETILRYTQTYSLYYIYICVCVCVCVPIHNKPE